MKIKLREASGESAEKGENPGQSTDVVNRTPTAATAATAMLSRVQRRPWDGVWCVRCMCCVRCAMPRTQRQPLTAKLFTRNHNQMSRISFTNLDSAEQHIAWDDANGHKKVGRFELPSFHERVNSTIFNGDLGDHSMGRIDLSKLNIKDKDTPIMDMYKVPSWYERLSGPSTYRIHEDIVNTTFSVPYKSFERCYARVLSFYFDAFLTIPRAEMENRMAKIASEDTHPSLQRQLVKIHAVERKLNELSLNTYYIYKRLKTPRETPPFYLYQPFSTFLEERDLPKLLDAYFKLPSPRPYNIKREDFEILMSFLLQIKVSGDQNELIPLIVDVFEDIRKAGNVSNNLSYNHDIGIRLTPFEETKYLSLLLCKWRDEGLTQEMKFKKVLKLKHNNYLKGEENVKLQFSPAMWEVMVSHFPEYSDEIMKMMANETGISRLTAETLIKCLSTYDELCNALDLMKLKNYHMDPQLFDIILEKHIQLGRLQEAYALLDKTMSIFRDVSDINWQFQPQKYARAAVFKYDLLNKTFQQLDNEKVDQPVSVSWIQYKLKPSPFVVGNLLLSLSEIERPKLLKLMIKQKIPLVNKHALTLLEQENCSSMLPLILTLTNESSDFNKNLHIISKDARYDTVYYKQFLLHSNGVCFELLEIFRRALESLKAQEGGAQKEWHNSASNQIKNLRLILEKESETLKWK